VPGTAAVPGAAPGGKALRLAGGFPDPVSVIPASSFWSSASMAAPSPAST